MDIIQKANVKLFKIVLTAKANKLKKNGKLTYDNLVKGSETLHQIGVTPDIVDKCANELLDKLANKA